MADATAYIYSLKYVEQIHELEPLTSFANRPEGAPGGMLFETSGQSGTKTYVPKGWTKLWPIDEWQPVNDTAFSRVGSTEPEVTSCIYFDYLGEEIHKEGTPPADMLCSAFLRIEAAGWAPMGDATNFINGFTCYVSYNFGETWRTFFQVLGKYWLNGTLSDRLGQTFTFSATRLGMRKPEEATDEIPQYSRLVFDNTFFHEAHQLWLEDPDERVPSKGGIGVKPFFECAAEGATDPEQRLAVHSGSWGVIRKRNVIVAATSCPVNWCQNSDGIQIPVPESPFCYSVNYPKDILWIGPAIYIDSYNDPDINWYFQGAPQEDAIEKWTTDTGYWGEPGEFSWRDDGMRRTGAGGNQDAAYMIGWSPTLTRAYWDPDYRTAHTQYSYPYTSYWTPTSTTVILLKQDKTAGDVPVWTNQVPGGNDAITSHVDFKVDQVWYSTGGLEGGNYGYAYIGTEVADPYATSLWTFTRFKKLILSLREYAPAVAKAIIEQWGGIVRTQIRTIAERDKWNNTPCEIKQRDMAQMGCTIVGEYDITGRYNTMTRALFSEFTYYSAGFLKFFVAEEGSGEASGNVIFELLQSAQNPKHYAVSVLPSKSFGNVIFGVKSYYEKTHVIERRQCLNIGPSPTYTYNQEQYGMIQYAPVVSEDGGITWHDVTGLTKWNNTIPKVQFKPIWLGGNQWICEHDSKVYKSFTGVGWSPLEYTPDEEWQEKLDPALDETKTYPIAVPCRNEWVVIHQYEDLTAGVVREPATVLDKTHLRMDRPVLSVDGVYSQANGFEKEYKVKEITTSELTVIVLEEALPTIKVRERDGRGRLTGKWTEQLAEGVEVFVSYQSKTDTARMFHIVTDGSTNLTWLVKDLSFVGNEWFPKQNMDMASPYDPSQGYVCAINTLSGGLLSHLYYRDPIISAKANLFPGDYDPIEFKTSELPDIVIGADYFAKIEVSGGTSVYKFVALTKPSGLSIDATSGEITGIVATEQDYTFRTVCDDSSTPAYADPTAVPAADDINPPIYGYVYNGAGEAVADAEVSVVNPATGVVESTVKTDAKGRYTVNLPANTSKILRMGKGECVGSDLVSIAGGCVDRWDGNIGNGTKGTTTMGIGVNQKPPYDQERGATDPATADDNYQGTRGAMWPVPVKYVDDRGPEYVLTTPNFERFVFGEPVTIKLYYAYTDPNVEAEDPFVTMVYNSPGFPPDLLPTARPVKLSEQQLKEIVGTAMPYAFGWGRFGLEATITGTLDAVNPDTGVPYTTPVTFNIPPIGLLDSKGRSVYSSTITLTGVPLTGEESVPPEITIDAPQPYTQIGLGEKVTIKGSASDDSGLSSLTVGGETVVVDKGQKRVPFAQELTMQEPGCIKVDVVAVDASMRKNTATKSVYVRVGTDSQGPELDVSVPSSEDPVYMFSPSYEFSGSASDSGKGDTGIKQVKIGNQIVAKSSCDGSDTVNWIHKYTGLSMGTNELTIEAEDNAGNKTTVTRTIVRHEDSVGPNINITSPNPIDIYSYGSEHTITGTITDSGYGNNGVERSTMNGYDLYQPGGTKKATCTGNGSVSFEKQVALAMGYNSFSITAWDELGNRTELTVIIRRIEP